MSINLRLPYQGNVTITARFGEVPEDESIKQKYHEWGMQGHNGVDYGVVIGTPVLAVAGGRVEEVSHQVDFGDMIIVRHRWGVSLYAHLSQFKVKIGQQVRKGQCLGLSGQSGFVTGPHLHLGIKLNNADVNNGYLGFSDPQTWMK